jgi:hypothetical protein
LLRFRPLIAQSARQRIGGAQKWSGRTPASTWRSQTRTMAATSAARPKAAPPRSRKNARGTRRSRSEAPARRRARDLAGGQFGASREPGQTKPTWFESRRTTSIGASMACAHEKTPQVLAAFRVVPLGFEPRLTDPESVVLPLHQGTRELTTLRAKGLRVKPRASRERAPAIGGAPPLPRRPRPHCKATRGARLPQPSEHCQPARLRRVNRREQTA